MPVGWDTELSDEYEWAPLRLPPDAVPWARRQLALLRADNGDEAGYQEALALLEANGNRDLADVRATAFVKATRGKEKRTAALHVIEAVGHGGVLAASLLP